MDQRRRGAVCLSLGLGLLSGLVWFDTSPAAVEPSSTMAPLSVEQTLEAEEKNEFVRLRYQGRGASGPVFWKRGQANWQVDVYRLPRGADGLMPVVVHLEMESEANQQLPPEVPRQGESVSVCWIDRQGQLVRWLTPPAAAAPLFDPMAFVMPLPRFANSDDVQWATGPDGSHWQMRLAPDQEENAAKVVVEAQTHSVAERMMETQRSVRIHYDRRSRMALRVEADQQGHWRRKDAVSRFDMELVGSVRIPEWRLAAFQSDLTNWNRADQWVREVALRLSATPTTQGDCSAPSLEDLPQRITAIKSSLSDPVTRIALGEGLPSLHTHRSRMLGVKGIMEQFGSAGSIGWTSTDLSGVSHCSTQYHGKAVAMGFICRSTQHAVSTAAVLEELRERFPEDELAVLAFATTFSRENAEAIQLALGPDIPMFHDLDLAQQLRQFDIGIPTILLVDGKGRIRFIHTWHAVDLTEDICDQVQQIRTLPSTDSESLHQFTQAAP